MPLRRRSLLFTEIIINKFYCQGSPDLARLLLASV